MSRILIIQTAFIGDAVLATGILEKLHHYFPSAQIDFLVRKGNEPLLENHPFLNKLLIWEKKKGKLKNLWGLLKTIRKAKYDKVINVQRFAATGLLTAFSGAKETIGYDKNPLSGFFSTIVPHIVSSAENQRHEIDRCNDLIKHFTDDIAFKPRLYPSKADLDLVKQFKNEPYIVVAPASVWFTKQFPADKWVAFLKRISTELNIYIIGAPADEPLAESIIAGLPGKKIKSLCGKLSFLQSTALIRDAKMNYVNDSAPMHFASSVNAPTAAIYCSTVPAFGFGPLSEIRAIIETEEYLTCRPCGLHGYAACPEGHFKCAWGIREDQLLNVL
jgi:heptosyltransferase-2